QIIAGAIPADSGTVSVSGRPLANGDPVGALEAGVVMSYQHPRLDRELTVLENLFLGEEPRRFGVFFDATAARTRVRSVAPDFSPALLSRRLGSLSSGQIRMVSLVAALLRLPHDRPGILILDEPTEATTPAEADRVFTVIRQSAVSGHAVILISHKLPEVERIADAVTVLRAGRTVASWSDEIEVARLAREMVGGAEEHLAIVGATHDRAAEPRPSALPGDDRVGETEAATPPLRMEGLTAREGRRLVLDDITLSVSPGEIVGVTGIRENGIEAMESLLAGKIQPDAGVFEVDGHDATGLSPGRLRRLGLRYVPTDRLLRGASVESSVAENLIALKRRKLQRLGMLDGSEVSRFASRLHTNFGIEGNLHIPLWQLSGGNIQKVILSRELEGDPRLLVICEPSWGLDFRSRARIVERIRTSARDGAAVLVLTTDIDEVLDLSSRIAVLFDARIAAVFDRDEATRELIGRAMAGATGATRGE
ncbi:MAG TPA: ATP-binding cassette domain-containing protein, partial [Myxococcota bacterium]|nr:ATP-binding cassette domain-containing protein [Myxococcota bacterium]